MKSSFQNAKIESINNQPVKIKKEEDQIIETNKQQVEENQKYLKVKKEQEKWNEKLMESKNNLVTRVLYKDTLIEDVTNFQYQSDLSNWRERLEIDDLLKINQLKTNRFVDINDKFRSKFNDELEFLDWFTPNRYKYIKSIFLNQKKQLNDEIHAITTDEKEKKKSMRIQQLSDSWTKSNEQKDYMNNKNNQKFNSHNQIQQKNLYKNKIVQNHFNKTHKKKPLSEEDKIEIIQKHQLGFQVQDIADDLKRNYCTVYSFLTRFINGQGNRAFFKYEIRRKQFNPAQMQEIENQIEKQFEAGDGAKVLKDWIAQKWNINIKDNQAYSLLYQFGFKRVRISTKQYDSGTKKFTLCRHLFNLQIISLYLKSNIEIYSVDEFGLQINHTGNQIFRKSGTSKFCKVNNKQEKKYNIIVGCSKKEGPICWQISEKPQNSFSFHEFILKFRDKIRNDDLDSGKSINILEDDAAFHGAPWTVSQLEDESVADQISYTHLGGMLSMVNVAEQQIGRLRTQYNLHPSKHPDVCLKKMHKCFAQMNNLDGLKIYKQAVHTWLEVLDDVYKMLGGQLNYE